jgi:predicted nucleic acid-binding protein
VITAVDSNVLLDILRPNAEWVRASQAALEEASTAGSLIICDLVYAEICGHFADQGECDQFLADTEIRLENLSREAAFLASLAWRAYRRRGGRRVRILPDFLIGAHAQVQASQLLTRDEQFYEPAFPRLRITTPRRR